MSVRVVFSLVQPEDLLRMETIVLSCLGFSVTCPTSHTFLSLVKAALTLTPQVHSLAAFLIVSP